MELAVPKALKKHGKLSQFLQSMISRLAVGSYRYGEIEDLAELEQLLRVRVDKYVYVGDKELLIDIASLAYLVWRRRE